MSGQNGQPQAAASAGTPNPFQPASLQHRMSIMEMNKARKRLADSDEGDADDPEIKRNKLVVGPDQLDDYVQVCELADCVHVVVNVGNPSVKFTLCKSRLQHESQYFRAAFGAANNFEEGQNLTTNLADTDPEAFLLYIKSIFPTCYADFEALPITCLDALQDQSEAKEPHIATLVDLFQLIDRFGSLSSANVKQRLLKCMTVVRKTTSKSWLKSTKLWFLKHFSKYNMDQDSALLEQLLKIKFVIDDVETMNDVKPTILHPIMAKTMEKLESRNKWLMRKNCKRIIKIERLKGEEERLKNEIKRLEKVMQSPNAEAYCQGCNNVIHVDRIPIGHEPRDTLCIV